MRIAGVRLAGVAIALTLVWPGFAAAGPPFLTDDPEPTDLGHWEIYAPAFDDQVRGADYGGSLGAEVNFGAAPDLQLTLGLPISYVHDASGTARGAGDLEVSAKYRFYHDETAHVSVAVFPGLTLPTATHSLGAAGLTALLPIWAEKDSGPWSIFGGGGYAINPGAENHNYWTGGVAVSRSLSDRLTIGAEIDRQGVDTVGGHASTSLGVGAILQLKAPFRLLASGGPIFEDGGNPSEFHAFLALGMDF